ncbi:DgyrCDS12550 [Dimorphilus gyrociliatus]|uniref:DgyrCDS12550 n=1 Tax=Dimorphilus gyrociliatus TaxID=2664684 RepID=A0A7I8W6T4_9ANNE|nr:DgyrCDS12550 [Dimorphilus gyrociliatus]
MVRAAVLLPQGAEEMEAVIVQDVLKRAEFDTILVSLDEAKMVTCSRKVGIAADKCLNEIENEIFDIVVLPGGLVGTQNLKKSTKVKNFVETHIKANKYIGAICAAPLVLKEFEFFKQKDERKFRATYHDSCDNDLKDYFERPNGEAVVLDDKLITSKGPGTAFDFAINIVKLLKPNVVNTIVPPMMFEGENKIFFVEN